MVQLRHFLWLAGLTAVASAHDHGEEDPTQKPMALSGHCHHPAYKTHIFSKSPLVIYLSGFLTDEERAHLVGATKDTFTNSAVADETGTEGIRQTRTSQSTNVPRDAVVRCIEERALLFQGFDTPRSHLEPVQLVRYGVGEQYHFHTDWYGPLGAGSGAAASLGGNRATSFFAYVDAAPDGNLTGGGTNFPMLDPPRNRAWCAFVDCDEPYERGVTFRPVLGNAVFWQNLQDNGSGDQRNLHAGLPVTSGWKIGMNIWTRQGPLGDDIRGPDV